MTNVVKQIDKSSMKKRKNKENGGNKPTKIRKTKNEEAHENENENIVLQVENIEESKSDPKESKSDPNESEPEKKMSAKDYRNSFKSATGPEDLKKFVKDCKETNSGRDLVSEYLDSGGNVLEILRLLESSDKKNYSN